MEDKQMEEVEQKLEAEVAPALVAVHPDQEFVSVSVGSDIRVFNLRNGCGVTLVDEGGGHKDSVRAIRFSRSGRLFVSVGDDKLLKVWDTQNWRCAYSVISEKRLTSVAISVDERFVCFADKFGVVYAVDVGDYSGGSPAPVNKKGVPILSHYCSIITRLEFSPDGRYIVTADRDFKIRVTVFPKKSLDGAHEIHCFCLGHTEFVSCVAFVSCPNNSQGLLVSGSGDSTVRLWEYASGSLLSTCEVGAKAGLLSSNEGQDEVLPAVTDLCATSDGSLIAVAIQSFPGIMLLSCNQSAETLSVNKMVSVKEEAFIPTSLGASCSASFLWMAMGASTSPGTDSTLVARLRVVSGFCSNVSESSDEPEPVVLDDSEVPKGEGLLVALQGKLSIGEEAFSTAADAVKTAMRNLMIKKQYSAERREERKRGRNDKKNQIPACS